MGYKYLGTAYLYQGKMDSALNNFEKAVPFESEVEPKERAAIRNNLAITLQKLGRLDDSFKYYSESLTISKSINDSIGIARSCFNIGTYYRVKSQFNFAILYFDESLKIYSLLNEKASVSQVLNSLGLIKKTLKDYKKALDIFHECLEIRLELNDNKGVMDVENNIAATYIDLKDYESALMHQKVSLQLAEQFNSVSMLAGSYTNLGIIYKELGDSEQALQHYENAIELFNKIDNKRGLLTCYTNLGLLQIELNQFNLAEANLKKAKNIANSLESIESIVKIDRGLSDLYSRTGKCKEALENYVELDALTDSIFSLESAKQLADVQEKYETAKKNEAIQALQTKSELDEQRREIQKQKIQLLVIALIAVLMLVMFLFARIRFKKKWHEKEKEQMILKEAISKQELEMKNRKLTAFAAETLQKNSFIDELSELFDEINADAQLSEEHLNKYKELLKNNKQEKDNWETFKVHFENVHPEFFQRLQMSYPKFTQNDLRICAYIKMGLVNKEIASLMNIAPASVKMSKTRIKKKMDLDENTDLTDKILLIT
ncbi:tetratricopeptide repeat protein [Paracrocinitomix mangrovi]|uniref:tetratricopeptide repeat protein n=1 Tax=Paracrocinitomix mangrovi TaxID=2862509 RepID=UPI001C8D4F38|nr:tetratricopeptide repeat protein [Paracrocinitomix mangrovi]UKN00467.1 tetratricopeptide repeat protein [Paracrocinitomix mangrovi]